MFSGIRSCSVRGLLFFFLLRLLLPRLHGRSSTSITGCMRCVSTDCLSAIDSEQDLPSIWRFGC